MKINTFLKNKNKKATPLNAQNFCFVLKYPNDFFLSSLFFLSIFLTSSIFPPASAEIPNELKQQKIYPRDMNKHSPVSAFSEAMKLGYFGRLQIRQLGN